MSEQLKLIHVDDIYQKHWVGMPEFEMQDLTSHKKLIVHFESEEDFKAFEILIGQSIGKLSSGKNEVHFEIWQEKKRLNPIHWVVEK